MLFLVRAREQREARVQLNDYAAEAPHVDLLRVREQTEDDVGRSIEPRLDVRVNDLVLEAATAKVSDDDTRLVLALQQYILRLQVAMDDPKLLEITQGRQQLNGKASDQIVFKALVMVHLDELVQVDAVEVEHAAQVVPEDEVVAKLHDPLDLVRVIVLQQQQ